MVEHYDVVIIGAGIMGCTMARELAKHKVDACVLESCLDVGEGATKANSGIIHTGFHPRGGSLKGTSCVQGNLEYERIAKELDVPFERIGGLYAAFHEDGVKMMRDKFERGLLNGAEDMQLLSGDEARDMEPCLSEKVIAALYAPSTGVISPFELTLATARNAVVNGVPIRFGFAVADIQPHGEWYELISDDGESVRARFVVNMAGEAAAILDAKVRPADIVVKPRRGQYVVFDKQMPLDGGKVLKHVLFQAQEKDEGGTLLTPTIDGNIMAGPTSENVSGFASDETTAQGIEHVKRVARKLAPDLDLGEPITAFAGIRANIVNVEKEKKDFVVRVSAPRFVSALGIKNPGMTSAPALVRRAMTLLEGEGLKLEPDPSFDPKAQGSHVKPFLACDPQEQDELLIKDPTFSHVLCRCEGVTEGDVRKSIRDVVPPSTFDGLKRRLRCSMGRCQGSFCIPRIAEVFADAMGMELNSVLKRESGGRLVQGRLK